MHPRMDVVNLGSRQDPRWYPAEKLQILAHQKFKGLVPSRLTHSIQQTACRTPPSAKALVALEGLDTLGAYRSDNNDVVLVSLPVYEGSSWN
jgi:eukaryotic translation initiation factor 2C